MMAAMKLAALLIALAFVAVPAHSEAQVFRSQPTAKKAKAKPKAKARPKKAKSRPAPVEEDESSDAEETSEPVATTKPSTSKSQRQDKVSETDVVVIIDGE